MEHIEESLRRIEAKLEQIARKVDMGSAPPSALTQPQAARLLSIGMTKLKRMVREKQIRRVKIGGRWMVPMSEVVRLTSITTKARTSPTVRPSPPTTHDAATLREKLRREKP